MLNTDFLKFPIFNFSFKITFTRVKLREVAQKRRQMEDYIKKVEKS